jgi:nucleoside-diphosphate-sugar epimerase
MLDEMEVRSCGDRPLTVLITGAAGFVGSNLADRLLTDSRFHNKDLRIIGIDNLSYGVIEQVPHGVEFYQEDIRSKAIYPLFQDVDHVFHFAAKNCIADCQADPVETADINVTGTVNVFEAARKAGVRKVVYAESSALYEGCHTLPSTEAVVKPESFYATSKLATMYFAEAYSRFYGPDSNPICDPSQLSTINTSRMTNNGLSFTALRYFCVYGPRQDYRRTIPPVFSAFIIKLLKGEQPVIYGTGEKRRDFVYIDDINDFHTQCMMDERTTGKTFNLGSGKNYSVNEIYKTIAQLVGSDIKPRHEPDLPGEAFANLADITEAQKLGWAPKTDLITGLKASIEFMRQEMERGRIP